MKGTFIDKCDNCHCVVIDIATEHSKYTKTVVDTVKMTFSIRFYCPACIRKLKIITDNPVFYKGGDN